MLFWVLWDKGGCDYLAAEGCCGLVCLLCSGIFIFIFGPNWKMLTAISTGGKLGEEEDGVVLGGQTSRRGQCGSVWVSFKL